MYGASLLVQVKPPLLEVTSIERIRDYFVSQDFRRHVSSSEKYIQVSQYKDNLGFAVYADSALEISKRFESLKKILLSGFDGDEKIISDLSLKLTKHSIDNLKSNRQLILNNGATEILFSEKHNLVQYTRYAINKAKLDFLDALYRELNQTVIAPPQAEGPNRILASDARPLVDQSKLEEIREKNEKIKSEATELYRVWNLNDPIYESEVVKSIVNNIIHTYLQQEYIHYFIESKLAAQPFVKLDERELYPLGLSFIQIQIFCSLTALIGGFFFLFFWTFRHTEYDTKTSARRNYQFQVYDYADQSKTFLDLEVAICCDQNVPLPQKIVAVSLNGNELLCRFIRNMARNFSQKGAKILIIDMFRDPSSLVRESSFIVKNGLWNYLYEGLPLSECIYQDSESGFQLLPLGIQCGTETEIVDHVRYKKAMSELKEYDVIFYLGSFDRVADLSKVSYDCHGLYFFADQAMLRKETQTRLLRLFAVYNGVRRYLVTFTKSEQYVIRDQLLSPVVQ